MMGNRSQCGFGLFMAAILLLGCAGWAEAATVPLAWDADVVDKDLLQVNAYIAPGTCAAPGAFAKTTSFAATAVTGSITIPTDGVYCVKITNVDTANNESLFSNAIVVTVNVNPPQAPANLRSAGPVTP